MTNRPAPEATIEPRPAYEPPEFAELVERETEEVELKTGLGNRPLQDALVALSNTRGGVVFVGVTDKRQVVGRRLDQGVEDAVAEAVHAAHDLGRVSVRQVKVGDTPVVAVTVRPRYEGFAQTSDGRILVRRGPSKHALIGAEAYEFLTARSHRRFEQADSGVPVTAVSPAVLDGLADMLGWPRDGIHDRLRERGLLTPGDTLTVAGALCLTDPATSLQTGKFAVEVLRYPQDDGTSYDRRETFAGPVSDQVSTAAAFVSAELGADLVVTGLYRHELPKLPPRVVREAIANAVAHRSYETDHATIRVELRPSAVSVTSPGRLPAPVTLATMREAQAARNLDVLRHLRALRLAEDNGQGVDLMQDQMRDALLEPPVFSEPGQALRVTLSLHGPVTRRERAWLADLVDAGDLEPVDRLVLVHAARGAVLTNAIVRDVTGLDREASGASLRRLQSSGLVLRQGERGGARYTLVEQLAPPAAQRRSEQQLAELVVSAARERPIRNADVRRVTGLDRVVAGAMLARLVREGRLTMTGSRRTTTYRAVAGDGPPT